ncbi:hypothetical protein R3P38DRAFT_3332029 [Favolaschia claudopus]|uniref:Uncharacterized protein n=1 Tax=Favolaschia claudopus TaxID=2862362 RepID=A0AAV9ZPS0_9AGAR
MRLTVVSVQREYLELTGLLRYIKIYKPRLDGITDPTANPASPDNCIGCFTDDPRIAQMYWQACLPFWLIRPLSAFADENILRVVLPLPAADFLEFAPAPGYSPMGATDRLDDRLRLLHRCTQSTPWYRDPFESNSPSAIASTSTSAPIAGPSVGTSSRQASMMSASKSRGSASVDVTARLQEKAAKAARGPNPNAKPMPPIINAWSHALSEIDRTRPPACGVDLPQRYVMPEPALVVPADDEVRRRVYLHHYRMLRDGLLFRLTDRSTRVGKLVEQGKSASRARARSANIEDLLRPAFEACGINVFVDFPVPPEHAREMRLHTAQEFLWEIAEINFRYEFLSLDVRASKLYRPDECRRCFAGDGLLPTDFCEGQRGLGAREPEDRLPYLLSMAHLMSSWSVPCQRPEGINTANARPMEEWNGHDVRQLERRVARYYTQSFYELFGRAAVVPMRLEHELGT